MKRKTAFYILVLIVLIGLAFIVIDLASPMAQPLSTVESSTVIAPELGIPAVVHQTWKRSITPPSELMRWRSGCTKLNPGFRFTMYSDEELRAFTEKYYSRYLPMFDKLNGVYMADMVRVLIAYHFGGIYMDLDFYCHKPFQCLVDIAKQHIHSLLAGHGVSKQDVPDHMPKHILVVAREPTAHAIVFRNKTRVVIQDFYMATPRHPFLHWLLEDRLILYQHSLIAPNHSSSTAQPVAPFPKGPFSYSIEKDIDRYHVHQQHMVEAAHKQHKYGTNSVKTSDETGDDIIVELPEDVLHPLLDATNSRLYAFCDQLRSSHKLGVHTEPTASGGSLLGWLGKSSGPVTDMLLAAGNSGKEHGEDSSAGDADMRAAVCRDILQKRYFQPSGNTVMVHMWTHVYLGWSFVRGMYNAWTYHTVESTLPPTQSCA